jgi:hypothetical protein
MGGTIWHHFGPSGDSIRFSTRANFVVQGSIIEGSCGNLGATWVVSGGGTVESPGDTCGLDPGTDQAGIIDLGLWPLFYSGGSTMTLVPNPNSPAVDDPLGVISYCGYTDQRGQPRPVDGNGDGIDACDSGAVERQPDEIRLFYSGFESGVTSAWSLTVP